jgi:hypothetical protein
MMDMRAHSRILILAGILCSLTGGIAAADSDPRGGAFPTVPPEVKNNPYVQSVINALGGVLQTTNGNRAQGKVTFFRRFELQVETAPRVYREIHLHPGTVINPRGTTLTPGQMVEVGGAAQSDGSLNADVITVR